MTWLQNFGRTAQEYSEIAAVKINPSMSKEQKESAIKAIQERYRNLSLNAHAVQKFHVNHISKKRLEPGPTAGLNNNAPSRRNRRATRRNRRSTRRNRRH